MTTLKDKKIDTLLKDSNIFKLSETEKFVYYVVRGTSKLIYDVIYDNRKDDYTCNCKNIRLTPCYHIDAVKQFRNDI